jgi:hypothetical protein
LLAPLLAAYSNAGYNRAPDVPDQGLPTPYRANLSKLERLALVGLAAIGATGLSAITRLSATEAQFVCQACGKRGAYARPGFQLEATAGCLDELLVSSAATAVI